MPPKASSLKKQKVKKGKKTKKTILPTLVTMPVSDSDKPVEQRQSLLDTGAVGRLARSVEDEDGGDGSEASTQRHRPSATVTSGAALSDEEEGAPRPPKRSMCLRQLTQRLSRSWWSSSLATPTSMTRLSRSLRTWDARITC